ncbi:hypothetical protein GALL_86670 [mine drainage metagenome]|uniref:Uncharacterized protein n=1 Tax=mine drainage metagenome TaxID=410659 RepID=A0A1J5SYI5_9ZZZZ
MENQLNLLLDAVDVTYGPRPEIGRYILLIAEQARALGVTFHLGRGFERLLEVNRLHADSWSPLAPTFDPRCSEITADTALYIEGRHDGEPVVTLAIRRYDWPASTLAEEWESGRFAYRDPARQMQAEERWVAGAPAAASIGGRVTFGGGLWFRRDFRGRRIPLLTAGLMRCLSLTTWNPDYAIGMLETGLLSRALLPLYGHPPAQAGMLVEGGWKTLDSTLIWESREDLKARIYAAINKAEQPEAVERRIRNSR